MSSDTNAQFFLVNITRDATGVPNTTEPTKTYGQGKGVIIKVFSCVKLCRMTNKSDVSVNHTAFIFSVKQPENSGPSSSNI